MANKAYHKYINSRAWRVKRLVALDHYGRKCQKCGSKSRLHVHHLSYKNFKSERLDDLMIVCEKCHKAIHSSNKKKKKKGKKSRLTPNERRHERIKAQLASIKRIKFFSDSF